MPVQDRIEDMSELHAGTRHVTLPLLVGGGVVVCAGVLHYAPPMVTVGVWLVAVVLVVVGYDHALRVDRRERPREWWWQNGALTAMWVAGAVWTVVGPLPWPALGWQALATVAVWLPFAVPWTYHRRVRRGVEVSRDMAAFAGDRRLSRGVLDACGLRGVDAPRSSATADEQRWEVDLVPPPGMTLKKMQLAVPALAAHFGLPEGNVSIVEKAGRWGKSLRGRLLVDQSQTATAPHQWAAPGKPTDIRKPFRKGELDGGGDLRSEWWHKGHGAVSGLSAGALGGGKALDVDTPIATPAGWTTMGALTAGDEVFDETGQACRVLAAHDVRIDRSCYVVRFSDGSEIVADAEHLWQTDDQASRQSRTRAERRMAAGHSVSTRAHLRVRPQVRTTLELARTVRNRGALNHSIPVAEPLILSHAELPLAPYVLGSWLGDGSRHNPSITTADAETRELIEAHGYRCGPNTASADRCETFTVYGLRPLLVELGLLTFKKRQRRQWRDVLQGCVHCTADAELSGRGLCDNCYHRLARAHRLDEFPLLGRRASSEPVEHRPVKHIPMQYLRASEQQRRDLLAGLLDTDGTVSRTGRVQFDSTTQQLAHDVRALALSLGYRATVTSKTARLAGRDCGVVWRVGFTTIDPVFRLPRKVAAQKERLRSHCPARTGHRMIVAVEPVATRPVRCITVSSASRLYLAGTTLIPTHNTVERQIDAAHLVTSGNSLGPWIYDGKPGSPNWAPWGAVDEHGTRLADWYVTTADGFRDMVAACWALAETRGAEAVHNPTKGSPFVGIICDEARIVFAPEMLEATAVAKDVMKADRLAGLVREATERWLQVHRSTGTALRMSTVRAEHKSTGGATIRSFVLGGERCGFFTSTPRDAEFVFPGEGVDLAKINRAVKGSGVWQNMIHPQPVKARADWFDDGPVDDEHPTNDVARLRAWARQHPDAHPVLRGAELTAVMRATDGRYGARWDTSAVEGEVLDMVNRARADNPDWAAVVDEAFAQSGGTPPHGDRPSPPAAPPASTPRAAEDVSPPRPHQAPRRYDSNGHARAHVLEVLIWLGEGWHPASAVREVLGEHKAQATVTNRLAELDRAGGLVQRRGKRERTEWSAIVTAVPPDLAGPAHDPHPTSTAAGASR